MRTTPNRVPRISRSGSIDLASRSKRIFAYAPPTPHPPLFRTTKNKLSSYERFRRGLLTQAEIDAIGRGTVIIH
jgi:hypothetical protein